MRHGLMTNWMQEVDDMFRSFSPASAAANWNDKAWFSPAVDVQETEKEYLFHFDLPGMNEKDLNLTVTGKELHVTGERRKDEESENRRKHRTERFFGQFERSFILPDEVDSSKIDAQFKDGVLEIRVPKVEAVQPKSIPIRTH
ncbi:MAG: Hsp20/alpha crystallin family protein [Pseudobdellovibrionaceae bacterium]